MLDADWATHAFDHFPRVQVPKENQTQNNPISNLSTRSTEFDTVVVLVLSTLPIAHERTDWVWFQNKIRQT